MQSDDFSTTSSPLNEYMGPQTLGLPRAPRGAKAGPA